MHRGRQFGPAWLGVVAAVFAGAAMADTAIMERDSAMGKILTDAHGMTLYTFDKDMKGQSACYDTCAQNWPPLLAPEGVMAQGDFGLAKRTDGAMQWTYYGKPLYLWAKDKSPGDMTGDGVNGMWHIAKHE